MKSDEIVRKEVCTLGVSITSLILASFLATTANAQTTMSLNEYLARVQAKNRSVKSLEASTAAADLRYLQADLELSPVLTLKGSYLDDKSQREQPGATLTKTEAREYSMGLAKKFTTGTAAQLTTGVQGSYTTISTPGGEVPLNVNNGFVSLGLSQSLWKDSFGHSTRLRWERQQAQQLAEKQSYDLQAKQTLIDAEAAFWDLIYSEESLVIRKDSLERAKKIEGWVRRRVNNGIGDRADLLNAQGLTAARELELLSAEDDYIAAQKRVADVLELTAGEKVPALKGNLKQVRPMNSYVTASGEGRVVRLDSYLSVLDARAKEVAAAEAVDSMRPDLKLEGQYRTNGYDSTLPKSYSRANDPDYPTAAVSLTFTWLLDWETTGAVKNSAKQDALAARYTKERKLLESETSWSEIQRRHGEMTKKVDASDRMAKIQVSKAAAERDKLSKGRSITSNVITAEQDAAEAELMLTKLRAEQRKLESQGRLFVKVEDKL